MIAALQSDAATRVLPYACNLGALAAACLKLEVATYPKPGLVSHVDNGAHRDMDAALLYRSAATLAPFFGALAAAGAEGADMGQLRVIGIAAERAMLAATGNVNTHRGAIFGLGLLCAAAGLRDACRLRLSLGAIISDRWGAAILAGPVLHSSHGIDAARRHGVGGARVEAARGLPSVYAIGLPALRTGRALAPHDSEAARVQACMALIAAVDDTNLLHRGGLAGLEFARARARAFLAAGGVGRANWRAQATAMHRDFVARNLSPGGCADLLAMALFAGRLEA
jgi:triphosphoribosyl-dephospho-CoA synthase